MRDGAPPRARGRAPAGRLAPRRRSRAGRGGARRGSKPPDQGRLHRAQRDLDRRHLARRRGAPRDRPGRPSGSVHGRHDLFARFDRLSPRRVGRRRHGGRLAKGPDAAARPQLQRARRQGAGCGQDRAASQVLLGLGADAGRQCQMRLPLHARHESALRPARSAPHVGGRRARSGVRPARPARRGDPPGGCGLGARAALSGPARIFELVDRGADAGRARMPMRCAG